MTRLLIGTLVRHEWRMLFRSGVTTALTLTVGLVIVFAALLGVVRVRQYQRDAQLLVERERSALARSADDLANNRGTFALLPTAPLLGLAAGQSDVYPSYYRVTARLRDAQLASDSLTHPLALMTGELDLTFVVLYLYPLLILGVSFDLTATERATGTLRLVLAQGAELRALVIAKLASRLLVVLVPPIAAAGLAVLLTGIEAHAAVRLLWWTTASVLYGLFWLVLALMVNGRGHTSSTNALMLAGAWLALVVLIPSVVNLATRMAFPPPSRVELAITSRAATRDAVVQGSQILGRFLEDHPSVGTGEEGMRQYYALQDAREAAIAKQLQPLLLVYETQLARQRALIAVAQLLSPTVVLQLALTDAAGTSGDRHRWFAGQASRFQQRWKEHFPPDVLAASVLSPTTLSTRPVFQYVDETFALMLRRTVPPVALLALVTLTLGWMAIRAYDHYDIGA